MEVPSLTLLSEEQDIQKDIQPNKGQPGSFSRMRKGYKYESDNWCRLDTHSIAYESNPQTFSEWLKHTGTNYDIRVETFKKGWITVECKFTSKPIYHSWFMRDWYSRDCDIIVTNNKWNVPYEDRMLLKESGRKLLETHEFLNYVLRLCMKGNKYVVFEYPNIHNKSPKTDLFSVSTIFLDEIGGVFLKNKVSDLDYPYKYYCEQCLQYRKCEAITKHEGNRNRLYNYLEKLKHRQRISTLQDQNKDTHRFMQLWRNFSTSLDEALRCLRKRNQVHKIGHVSFLD